MKKVLALGFFDGVHIGHKRLLDEAVQVAKRLSALTYAVTFDDGFFVSLGRNPSRLTTLDERIALMKAEGIDEVIVLPSTKEFLSLSADEFLKKILTEEVKAVVCGEDFGFGAGKSAGIAELRDYCEKTNKELIVAETVLYNGKKVSSSLLREMLAEGEVDKLLPVLGRNYSLTGPVVRGRGEGAKFGFPTANISVPMGKALPGEGVYQTNTNIDGTVYRSVTNVGKKPTFQKEDTTVETLILQFDGNLYGKEITVTFMKKLRGIIKFDTPQELKNQIDKDIKEARYD